VVVTPRTFILAKGLREDVDLEVLDPVANGEHLEVLRLLGERLPLRPREVMFSMPWSTPSL